MASDFSSSLLSRFQQAFTLLEQLDPTSAPLALTTADAPQPRDLIIVFPSSFNPPTTAHLALLSQARQLHKNALIYAAISKQIIDKEHVERPLILDRVVLLEQVLAAHLPGMGVMLFNRGLYVEQARAVRDSFPAVTRLLLLVGFDKLVQIFDPHYYADRDLALHELFELAELLVAPRGANGAEQIMTLLQQPENQTFARHVQTLPFDPVYREVSSSSVRQHPTAEHLAVPVEVRRFIQETHAYDDEPYARDAYNARIQSLLTRLRKGESPGT